jgi:hypothetical protein
MKNLIQTDCVCGLARWMQLQVAVEIVVVVARLLDLRTFVSWFAVMRMNAFLVRATRRLGTFAPTDLKQSVNPLICKVPG